MATKHHFSIHTERYVFFALLLFVLACLAPAKAIAGTNDISPSLAAKEKEGCTRNLKIIYDAIQAYQIDHKDLPNWLSDLVPQYISDVNVFICPVCRRTGQAENYPLIDPKITSSYLYEFCPMALDAQDVPSGLKVTRRDWKRRQMGMVGSIVPLIRCRQHSEVLNLSFDGKVYDSPPMWEVLLTNQLNIADLTPKTIYASAQNPVAPNLTRSNYPRRDPKANDNLIDLTPYYNARFNDFWPGHTSNDLVNLTGKLQLFDGIKYDVRGIVQLRGKSSNTKKYPVELKGIKINEACNELHFLHAVRYGAVENENHQVGKYVVHFAAHQMQLEIPLIYGHEVRDWHPLEHELPGKPELHAAWTSANPINQKKGGAIRFFETTWTNIAPAIEIKTIDFISTADNAAPFLVAITAK